MNPVRLAVRVLRFDSRTRISAMLTAAGVALVTALMLILITLPQAAHARTDRSSWQFGHPGHTAAGTAELAAQDSVRGELIDRLDVSGTAGGGDAPKYPGPGEVLLSPALARKAAQLPPDRLAERFPGRVAGILDENHLRSPEQLVAVVGHPEGSLDGAADLVSTTSMVKQRALNQDALLESLAWFGLVVLAAPSLVLVASASRLTAARRERRMAALRMAGATPSQVIATAAAETGIAASTGTALGLMLSRPLRHVIASIPWGGGTWLVSDVTPSIWSYLAVAVSIPVLVALSAVLGTRRVVRSPLSAATEQQRSRPRAWRLLIIAVVGGVFVLGLSIAYDGGGSAVLFAALAAIVWSFSLVGPWITATIGRLFVQAWRRPSVLLAGRRLVSDPKGAYRSTSGVVLAVFIGSLAFTGLPALSEGGASGSTDENVVSAEVPTAQSGHLRERVAAELARSGVHAQVAATEQVEVEMPGGDKRSGIVVDCAAAREVTGYDVGSCDGSPALHSASPLPSSGLSVRPMNPRSHRNPPATPVPGTTAVRPMASSGDRTVLIDRAAVPAPAGSQESELRVLPPTPADREKVRTALAQVVPGADSTAAETSRISANLQTADLFRITLIGLTIAAVLAACSAAITAAGSVLDRRRTLGALLAAGTSIRVLVRALHTEAVLPALIAVATATVAGVGVGAGLLALQRQDVVLSAPMAAPLGVGVLVAVLAASASGLMLRKISAEPLPDE